MPRSYPRRPPNGGRIDLHQAFLRVQEQMLANLHATKIYDHHSTCGAITERQWIDMLNRYLPQRYRATSAFVVDARGERSRQIDIAVYDRFYSPLLFPDDAHPYIPAESVYAVFECKQALSPTTIHDAARKAASVRRLRRTSGPLLCAGSTLPPRSVPPIIAGILCLGDPDPELSPFAVNLLRGLEPARRLDFACSLRHATIETLDEGSGPITRSSRPRQALIYFILRLLQRLQAIGTAPPIDFDAYALGGGVAWDEPEP